MQILLSNKRDATLYSDRLRLLNPFLQLAFDINLLVLL